MINKKQLKELKALSNSISNHYQIGKNEITPQLLCMLDKALIAKELIKIDILKSCDESKMEIALDLSSSLNAVVVQVIGNVITLYRRNDKNPRIHLSK